MDIHINPVLLDGEEPFHIEIDGDNVNGYFRDTGRGPVGVYLHGFRSHCNGEKSLEIARHAHLRERSWIRFDMRGHGLSGGKHKNQLISSAVEDLLKVIDIVGRRPIVLHGSSMGGWVSVIAALRRQSQTRGLMLIAPAFNFVQNNFSRLPADVLSHWKASGYMNFPDAYRDEPYTLSYRIIADAQQFDVLDNPVQLNMPVHIVHGENDPIVPVSNTDNFIHKARISRLTYERIPGAGHRLTERLPLILSHIEHLWREI